MRASIYVLNEVVEMEQGVKKVSDIYRKSVIIQIGKSNGEYELHQTLFQKAKIRRTQIIIQSEEQLRDISQIWSELSNYAERNWRNEKSRWTKLTLTSNKKLQRRKMHSSFETSFQKRPNRNYHVLTEALEKPEKKKN